MDKDVIPNSNSKTKSSSLFHYNCSSRTHSLASVQTESNQSKDPYPGEPARESSENLELDLLGGRMASYYFESHEDKYKIDGLVLLLVRSNRYPLKSSQDLTSNLL